MPGTTTPQPKALPRLCVTQTTLPSRSAIENEVVWLAARRRRAGGDPLLGRAVDRLAVAHAARAGLDVARRDSSSASSAGDGLLLAMRTPAARRIAR